MADQEEGSARNSARRDGDSNDSKRKDDDREAAVSGEGRSERAKNTQSASSFKDFRAALREELHSLDAQTADVEEWNKDVASRAVEQDARIAVYRGDRDRAVEKTLDIQEEIAEMREEIDNFPTEEQMEAWKNEMETAQRVAEARKQDEQELEEKVVGLEDRLEELHNSTRMMLEDTHRMLGTLKQTAGHLKYLHGTLERDMNFDEKLEMVVDTTAEREYCFREIARDIDTHSDESAQLDDFLLQLADKSDERMDAAAEERAQLKNAIEQSYCTEKTALLKMYRKMVDINAEGRFHSRRGTVNKKPTQLTTGEKRIIEQNNETAVQLQDLSIQFEQLRTEVGECERLGAQAHDSLTKLRKTRDDRISNAQKKLADLRQLSEDLKKEKNQWATVKKDLDKLSRQERKAS